MDAAQLLSQVEHLEENIDDLEEKLAPLLSSILSGTTKKLPLLDRAKLYVLIVYAIESLLFSYLRLNGVNAKGHAIFKELTRVKQYFEKIKAAEGGPEMPKPNLSLDKQAAARFIKHALARNEKEDSERAERETKEIPGAKRKLQSLDDQEATESGPGRDKPDTESGDDSNEGEDDETTNISPQQAPPAVPAAQSSNAPKSKKQKTAPNPTQSSKSARLARKRKRKKERLREEKEKKAGGGKQQQEAK